MSYETPRPLGDRPEPCHYGASKLLCRGPQRALAAPYFAFLGSDETFGRFVETPFAAQVEAATGRACVNLGCVNAGIDSYLHDRDLLEVAARAELTVVQAMGAQNLSNRLFRVHPRRNDRFLAPTPLLQRLYPTVDFTRIHFNRHLLLTLRKASPERYASVRDELRNRWVARMRRLASALPKPPVLLWLRYDLAGTTAQGDELRDNPPLVDAAMVDRIRPHFGGVIDLRVAPAGVSDALEQTRPVPLHTAAASALMGPADHERAAAAVAELLTARH